MKELPTIWLDMDGTIADLYSVPDWLPMLKAENSRPYRIAKPMLSERKIDFLTNYVAAGGQIGIISWTSKCGSAAYNKRVRSAKVEWLKKNLPLPYAEIHVVKYGTPKSKFGKPGDILLDDEQQNLENYSADGKRFSFHPNQWNEMASHLRYYTGFGEGE